jgi:hypothetical protein
MRDDKLNFSFSVKDGFQKFFQNERSFYQHSPMLHSSAFPLPLNLKDAFTLP